MSLRNDRHSPHHPKATAAGQLVCPPLSNDVFHYVAAIFGGTVGKLSMPRMSANILCQRELMAGIAHYHRRHGNGWNPGCYVCRLRFS